MKSTDLSEEKTKHIVTGEDFKRALKLGATNRDYSKRKNSKYVVALKDGKKVHFGSPNYEDYLIHGDEDGRTKYLASAKKITNKKKNFNLGESRVSQLLEHSSSLVKIMV